MSAILTVRTVFGIAKPHPCLNPWMNPTLNLFSKTRSVSYHRACIAKTSTAVRASAPHTAGVDAAVWDPLARLPSVGAGGVEEHDTVSTGSYTDTIAAVVTAIGPGAVSIIRISGSHAISVAKVVFRPAKNGSDWTPETHHIYYGTAVDAKNSIIDEVLSLVMLGPKSYTAEDVVEIHTHGGGLCAARVLDACLAAGARSARPGEFSLRAFLNGRIDLAQAESVAALISARTVAAADSALAGIAGGIGKEVVDIRQECLEILAELDARLDFDEDLPPLDHMGTILRLERAEDRIKIALETSRQGRLLRSGLQVALVGRPNVGKSSLLNALSGSEKAIVTPIAGTTRDVVEASFVIDGIPITLLDTAGVRDSMDEVERIGVDRSLATAKGADIVIMVCDISDGWTVEDEGIMDKVSSSCPGMSLLVVNKCDIGGVAGIPQSAKKVFSHIVETSASTGEGLFELKEAVLKLSGATQLAPGGVAWAVNERQAEALTRAGEALARVRSSSEDALPVDFWTIDLRSALLALGEVSGEEVSEEVLGTIFSRFCIGK